MIPLLPELTAPSNSPKAVFGPPTAKLLQDGSLEQDGGAKSAAIAFDDLITAAFKTPEPATEPVVRGFDVSADTITTPDLKAQPGRGLPDLGKDVPENAGISVSPPTTHTQPIAMPKPQPDPLPAETSIVASAEAVSTFVAESQKGFPAKPAETGPDLRPEEPQNLPDPQQDTDGHETENSPLAAKVAAARPVAEQQTDAPAALIDPAQINSKLESEPAKAAPAAKEEPALVAAPLPPRNMRADQSVTDDERRRLPITVRPGVPLADPPRAAIEKAEPELAPRVAPKVESGPALSSHQTPVPAALTSLTIVDTAQSAQPQPAPAPAAPAFQPSPGTLSPTSEIRAEARVIPQIEQAIDALTDAREAGRTTRPEVLLRHGEFGLVSMRLDAAGGDLRATLASRDPGFVPAIQAALGERAVAASSETATSHNQQRGQEQGQNSGNSQTFSGNTGGFGQNYGSSPGSSQGSPQPRMAQQDTTPHGADESNRSGAAETPSSIAGGGGVFA